jgi:hypothetical protein
MGCAFLEPVLHLPGSSKSSRESHTCIRCTLGNNNTTMQSNCQSSYLRIHSKRDTCTNIKTWQHTHNAVCRTCLQCFEHVTCASAHLKVSRRLLQRFHSAIATSGTHQDWLPVGRLPDEARLTCSPPEPPQGASCDGGLFAALGTHS